MNRKRMGGSRPKVGKVSAARVKRLCVVIASFFVGCLRYLAIIMPWIERSEFSNPRLKRKRRRMRITRRSRRRKGWPWCLSWLHKPTRMKFSKDQREFVELLNSKRVRYLLVGGHAVGFHGYPRYTGDMDFFVETSRENAAVIAEVIRQFSFGALPFEGHELEQKEMVFQIGLPPNRIDILTSIDGLEFAEAWAGRIQTSVDGVSLWVIDRESLLRNKRSSGRPQDLTDVQQLQKRTNRESSGAG